MTLCTVLCIVTDIGGTCCSGNGYEYIQVCML